MWVTYKNGNYIVRFNTRNGTKIRETNDDSFEPDFAENCDVKITDRCDGACQYCYEGCSSDGRHGDILNYEFLDTLHPYTELAINGNDLTHPDLIEFMLKMKEKRVILNMTVNQIHFEKHFDRIKEWVNAGLIHGLGISLRKPTEKFVDMVTQIPNAVVHVINGIVSCEDLERLAGKGIKILVLGYKNLRRGVVYHNENKSQVTTLQQELKRRLFPEMIKNGWFEVVSFDNLAIEQLSVKEYIPEKQWDEFYMGDDGSFTFYLDLVDGTFGRDSLATRRYPIRDNIDDMFHVILREKEVFGV